MKKEAVRHCFICVLKAYIEKWVCFIYKTMTEVCGIFKLLCDCYYKSHKTKFKKKFKPIKYLMILKRYRPHSNQQCLYYMSFFTHNLWKSKLLKNLSVFKLTISENLTFVCKNPDATEYKELIKKSRDYINSPLDTKLQR